MSFEQFRDHCGDEMAYFGFGLRSGQTHPETYGELVDFIGDRLKIDESPYSVAALSRWLFDRQGPGADYSVDCGHINTDYVARTLLIGDLPDPDAYVASMPNEDRALYLPPLRVIRHLVAIERAITH